MLWQMWGLEDWSHGMLVPLIALGLVYWRAGELAQVPISGSGWGYVLLLGSLAAWWLGYRVDLKVVGYLSIQAMVASLIILFLGWRMMWAVFFPWLFLVFAWPMPFLDGVLALPLRHLMAGITSFFLNAVGIGTLLHGTALISAPFIDGAGNATPEGALFRLDVANPCSGMRSLFALMMVTAVFGYLMLPRIWQRVTLFACSIPLAIFGNFIRMVMLTLGTLWFGSEFAIGTEKDPSTYHMAAGFMVFAVALAGMLGLTQLLEWPQARAAALPPAGPSEPSPLLPSSS
jgi:exosortase